MIALHASRPEKHKQDYQIAIAVNHFINIMGMKDYADGLTCIIPGFPQKMWDRIYYPFFIDETLAQRCHVISKITIYKTEIGI